MDWNNRAVKGRFYSSKEWQCLRQIKIMNNQFCEICSTEERPVPGNEIHHIIEISDNPSKRLDIDNLQCLCKKCHSRITFGDHVKGAYLKSIQTVQTSNKWNLPTTEEDPKLKKTFPNSSSFSEENKKNIISEYWKKRDASVC